MEDYTKPYKDVLRKNRGAMSERQAEDAEAMAKDIMALPSSGLEIDEGNEPSPEIVIKNYDQRHNKKSPDCGTHGR